MSDSFGYIPAEIEGLRGVVRELRAALAKEKDRAEKAEALLTGKDHCCEHRPDCPLILVGLPQDAWPDPLEVELTKERDALRAECERLKAEVERAWTHARTCKEVYDTAYAESRATERAEKAEATLAEREAQHEHEKRLLVGESCSHLKHIEALGRALREREAEIERLKAENYLTGEGPSHLVPRVRLDRVTKERDEARAALAKAQSDHKIALGQYVEWRNRAAQARADALELAKQAIRDTLTTGLLTPPNVNQALLSIDRLAGALAKDTEEGTK
jgi:hypothetical protein